MEIIFQYDKFIQNGCLIKRPPNQLNLPIFRY